MRSRVNPSQKQKVVLAALLLLAASASGCGVGLPTQPDVHQTAGGERLATSMGTVNSETPLEMGDPSGGGLVVGDPQLTQPPAGETFVPSPGPGNRSWGHRHKKSRQPKS